MVSAKSPLALLLRAVHNPRFISGIIRDVGTRINCWYYRYIHKGTGIRIMDADWDNLLLLDACRPDYLMTESDWAVETRISAGANSYEFMQANFVDREFHDTVYVTANPFTPRLSDGTFHAIESLLDDGWDNELRTVHPETIATAARRAHDMYPHKRLLVHFMQPHTPFIGEFGRTLSHNEDFRAVVDSHNPDVTVETVAHKLQYGIGDVSSTDMKKAYRENLQVVLEYAEPLVSDLSGKTVISSDHGELLGERQRPIPVRGFGHTYGLHVPELVEVPWANIEGDSRREIRSDPPVEWNWADEDTIEQRLTELGYK